MSGLSVALRLMVLLAGLGTSPEPGVAHEIYVSNEKDNTVSVIDSKSLEVVRTFKVGKRPTIAEIDFVGSKEFDKDALKKALLQIGLADGRPFDKALVDRAEQELQAECQIRAQLKAS